MAKVTFNGFTLLDDDEGNFGFEPSVFSGESKVFVPLGRSRSLIPKTLATRGAVHRLNLRYKAITDEGAIRARLRNAFESGEGTLSCDGFDSIPNCEMMEPPPLSNTRGSAKANGSSRGMAFDVSINFMQVEE